MKAELLLLAGILLTLSLLPTVSGLLASCNKFASYSVGSHSWTVTCKVNDSESSLYYTAVVGLRESSMIIPVDGRNMIVTIYQGDVTNFSAGVLFDGALTGIKVPIRITIYRLNTSSGNFQELAEKQVEVELGMSSEGYVYSFIWGLVGLLLLFSAGYVKWDNGKGLVGDLFTTYVVIRGIHVLSLSSFLMMPFTTFSMMSNGRSEASALVLSGISALLLLESAYALGIAKSKYPKVSFYTGLGWLAGIPLVFNFRWDDFFIPFILPILLSVPVAVTIWRYSELPYSKCHKALSLFETYSVPLGVGVALILTLHYTTKETRPLFAVFLASLLLYTYASKLAFNRLEWAKRKFDEDIDRIRKGGHGSY
ncbi:hypothetical protein [Thermococcus sp.]